MVHSLDEIESMINEEILKQSGIESKNNTNFYLMYAVGIRFGCLVVFLLFLLAFFINIPKL